MGNIDFSKLKIYLINQGWSGGTFSFFEQEFIDFGCQLKVYRIPGWNFFRQRFIPTKLLTIDFTKKRLDRYYRETINKDILNEVKSFKPDIFFVQNESDLLPETICEIKNLGVITVNLNGDYAFDSSRFKYFPIMLKYYDFVFYGEKIWIDNYLRVAPNTKFIKTVGAYCEKYFFPLDKEILSKSDIKADISFAGTAYGFKAEGQYRAEILNSVADLGLKIWGSDAWERYFGYFPKLKNCYVGKTLPFQDLNILYQNSIINLNITNPQCLTAFQQRTFEIATAGAFQIADYKEEIFEYFNTDEIETFKIVEELKDKLKFYINNPLKRIPFIDKSYARVQSSKNTYKDKILEYLNTILL